MTNPSDKAVDSALAAQGELAALMVRYGPALKRYFMRKAGPGTADDLVQDVFLRLQVRAEHASLKDVERFIFTIAKRVLIDRRRFEARREGGRLLPFDDAMDAPDEISPERILAAKQEYARAVVAILALPATTRTIFAMHRFGKLSYGAIARRLGLTKRTVQGHMQRAVESIAEKLRSGS